ncbi:trace amine-associated receptor 1-like [Mugil cephalus]|uniref:trace amine-associated receptor 1-like n=1 Tax=Mugil cephalus TaxID=48193 RepID=UPI001FB66054|nr:trace amine-associated receptor 1-like [Mugil cephalus]
MFFILYITAELNPYFLTCLIMNDNFISVSYKSMEQEPTVYTGYDMHPCYKIHNASNMQRSPSTKCVLLYVFLGSLSVVTTCGNLLVIISIIYFKQLHTPTNYLVLSLAVADLLVGTFVFPSSMVFPFSLCLYHENLVCKVRDCFDVSLCASSILNLCCISIDRYHAVCQPLTYRAKINHHNAVVMIILSWTVSIVTGIGFTLSDQKNCTQPCTTSIGFTVTFYLPVIVMLCIYLKIFFVAQRHARSIQNTTKSRATVSKMERKATKTLAIVMGVFLGCWFPFFFCITFLSVSISVPVPVIEALNWLVFSNSMLNPFIYAFFFSWFRSAFRMIISGRIFQGDFTNSKL